MVWLGWGMLAAGAFGLLTSTIFLCLVLAGTIRFQREASRQLQALQARPEFLPPLSLLKPLHGAETGLEGNLRGFYEQDYFRHAIINGYPAEVNGVSRVEVLFCARNELDEGLAIARRVAADYPEISTRFCTSGEPWAPNAKVCSLVTMAKEATHDLWVVSDSDVRVDTEYLRWVVEPFADEEVGCATCLYRGMTAEGGVWSRLEAVGMTVEMSSGVCAANLMETMQFALGPTMAMRRQSVESIGGFEAAADYCADDFVLGNWIAKKGYKVVLSGHAIDHMVLYAGFMDSIRHQVRWMKSTRFSRPKGHFGTSLTFGVPFGLLAWGGAWLLGMPALGLSLLTISVVGRSLQAWLVGRFVVQKRRIWPTMILFPLRDLMGMLFWALSYTSNKILWRGEIYELVEDGRMRRVQ